jgi:hypothetical protein
VGIYETYSKRLRKRERAGQPDVYQYDELPQQLRNQVIHIWNSALGPAVLRSVGSRTSGPLTVWNLIHNQIARELGILYLGANPHADPKQQCERFLRDAETNEALDIIEFSFRAIQMLPQFMDASDLRAFTSQSAEDAIDELNHRFRDHSVGYQFEGGEIVRVDSEYVHTETVKPAIALLNAAGFEGPTEEFLEAHKHYRQGEYGDGIADALKAFESTMKAICDENGWNYNREKDTASGLIKAILDNGLVPRYMESHLGGLRNTLGAGLPTVRNKLGGHGQGKEPRKVPDYFAGYALHLAATNIVFLVEAHEALNQK